MARYLFTSECVTMGHPDKVADQISDGILDAVLAQDPNGRVACETLVTLGLAVVAGEITTNAHIDYSQVVRQTIKDIGYEDPALGFDADNVGVMICLNKQSPDIAQGVDEKQGKEQGAGDQGMMVGFACRETEELMPLPISLARKLVNKLAEVRIKKELPYLRPDGKTQVTVTYENGKPLGVSAVVVSCHHDAVVAQDKLRKEVIEHVIHPIIPANFRMQDMVYHINPTGRFEVGGPKGDTGLTGRKIIVDTYGGMGRHGGGAFSGKDPSKVDRSAAYMGRYIAKNLVAAGVADKCEIQLAYVIGVADPVSIFVETFGTGKIPEEKIAALIRKHFQLKPKGIIDYLQLKRPIYLNTARYGHFGGDSQLRPWEKTDKAESIKKDL